jgi:hypothetical protein
MKLFFRLSLALFGIAALFTLLSVCGLDDPENHCSDCAGTGYVDGAPCPTCSPFSDDGTLPVANSDDDVPEGEE